MLPPMPSMKDPNITAPIKNIVIAVIIRISFASLHYIVYQNVVRSISLQHPLLNKAPLRYRFKLKITATISHTLPTNANTLSAILSA